MNDKNNLSNNDFSNTNENTKMEGKILEQLGNEQIVSNSNTNIDPNIPPNINDQITTNDINNLAGQPLHTENSHTSTKTPKKKSNKKLLILIPIFIVIILIILFIFNLIKSIFTNTFKEFSSQEKNYISLDMPLSYEVQSEKDYIESKVYTFIYDSDRIVKRIIFTDFFYTEEAAKTDYEKYQKSNNYNNYWNMPKKLINLDKKVLTYEYEDDIAEEYYDDFIGENIDNIIEEYGEDRILNNFKPNVSAKDLSLNAKESQTSNSDKLNDSKSKDKYGKEDNTKKETQTSNNTQNNTQSNSNKNNNTNNNTNNSTNNNTNNSTNNNTNSNNQTNTQSNNNSNTQQNKQQQTQPENNTPSVSVSKQNALKSAQSYLSFSAFSRKGLIEQLEYEGFTSEQASYGVNNCGANWNEQAVKAAKSYLSFSSFSHDGLVEQLEYEGFTHEQAEYGVTQNGL